MYSYLNRCINKCKKNVFLCKIDVNGIFMYQSVSRKYNKIICE